MDKGVILRKTYHLGIMSYCSHDPSAAMVELIHDQNIIRTNFIHFEEGMISRRKKSFHFPSRYVSSCLEYFGIELSEVTHIRSDFMDIESFNNTSLNYRKLIGDYIRKYLDITDVQISKPIHHHEAHALSSWVGSGYEDSAFLAIDGLGSQQSTHSVFISEGGKLIKLFSQTTPGIGILYSLVTELIGFKEGEEGKTMGLAPYGKKIKEKLKLPDINFQGNYGDLFVDYSKIVSRSPNKSLLVDFELDNYELFNIYEDYRAYLAYEIQNELERCLLHLAKQIKRNTGKNNLCLSGGVALNCVANEILVNSEIFDEVYVFPDSADSGIPIGLAFSSALESLDSKQVLEFIRGYKHPKFAPEKAVPIFNSKVIQKLEWDVANIDIILNEIENHSVVAMFQGGWEYGPRALGRRSFLASATNQNMKKVLNAKIKHREAYRPFAPICLSEDFDDFFISTHRNHEFMTYAVQATEKAKQLVPAVVHADGTSRVQIVSEDCGLVHKLLTQMKVRSGYGILINTSFNDNDEPIVLDELDAVYCFLRTNADLLVVNDKMLFRNKVISQTNFESILIELESEVKNRNTKKFSDSLAKIMKFPTEPLDTFLRNNLIISKYQKIYNSKVKFQYLIQNIRNKKIEKFKRVLVSKQESDTVMLALKEIKSDFLEIATELKLIDDDFTSVEVIQQGDLIISYNLSNILRDLESLKLVNLNNFEVFYDSYDYKISVEGQLFIDKNDAIYDILKTYENNNDLSIENVFDHL